MTKKKQRPAKSKAKKGLLRRLTDQIHTHKKAFAIYVVLRVMVIVILVLSALNGNFENVFLCALTLALFLIPSFVEINFHIQIPDTLEIVVFLFIFAAEILGELSSFYTHIPIWDTMLHTVNGFLAAAIGYSMVDLLNRNDKFALSLSPKYLALMSFCFSMTIGVLWEFFEFGMDMLFATDMQKDFIITQINTVYVHPDGLNEVVHIPVESLIVNGEDWIERYGGYLDIGLIDTMKDLLVNFVGAVVFSIIGYFHTKSRGKNNIARQFILTPKEPIETPPDITKSADSVESTDSVESVE